MNKNILVLVLIIIIVIMGVVLFINKGDVNAPADGIRVNVSENVENESSGSENGAVLAPPALPNQ